MNDRRSTLDRLVQTGVIAVIRAESGEQLVSVCRALGAGGVSACEITMTTPGALEAIAQARRELGDAALVGAGSVLDTATARAAILAGARFIFSPVLSLEVIEMDNFRITRVKIVRVSGPSGASAERASPRSAETSGKPEPRAGAS